ncbi:MAG: hypothetical protein ACYC61_05685 [Isosphaeraceae bacterium]
MSVADLRADDLKKLPLRAIVAFGARCARRVEHLAQPPEGHPDAARWTSAITRALELAEDFARGQVDPRTDPDAMIGEVEACWNLARGDLPRENAYAAVVRATHAAAAAWHATRLRDEPERRRLLSSGPSIDPASQVADVTTDLAALGAFTAAVDAADAIGATDGLTSGAATDYRRLLDLKLGNYPETGRPIDPSPGGPLGPLGT